MGLPYSAGSTAGLTYDLGLHTLCVLYSHVFVPIGNSVSRIHCNCTGYCLEIFIVHVMPPFAISLMYMEISSIMLSPETSPHLLHIRGMIQVVEIIIGLLREFDLLEQFLGRSSDLAG